MILSCEGYKMFRGTATIVPKNNFRPSYEVKGDWLYKPEWNCWYVGGQSFPAEIVTDIKDE